MIRRKTWQTSSSTSLTQPAFCVYTLLLHSLSHYKFFSGGSFPPGSLHARLYTPIQGMKFKENKEEAGISAGTIIHN